MEIVRRIATETPIWVFALLGLLLWLGYQSLRTRKMPLRRLLVAPVAFCIMGISRLIQSGGDPKLIGTWVAAAAIAAGVAIYTSSSALTIDRSDGSVIRPGSVIPLVRNLTIFVIQYAVAVVTAMKLDAHGAVPVLGQLVSGACTGYFVGWMLALVRRYRSQNPSPAS